MNRQCKFGVENLTEEKQMLKLKKKDVGLAEQPKKQQSFDKYRLEIFDYPPNFKEFMGGSFFLMIKNCKKLLLFILTDCRQKSLTVEFMSLSKHNTNTLDLIGVEKWYKVQNLKYNFTWTFSSGLCFI